MRLLRMRVVKEPFQQQPPLTPRRRNAPPVLDLIQDLEGSMAIDDGTL